MERGREPETGDRDPTGVKLHSAPGNSDTSCEMGGEACLSGHCKGHPRCVGGKRPYAGSNHAPPSPPLLGLWASVSPAAEWGCSAQLGGGGELVCACLRVKGLALGNGWTVSPRPSPRLRQRSAVHARSKHPGCRVKQRPPAKQASPGQSAVHSQGTD